MDNEPVATVTGGWLVIGEAPEDADGPRQVADRLQVSDVWVKSRHFLHLEDCR